MMVQWVPISLAKMQNAKLFTTDLYSSYMAVQRDLRLVWSPVSLVTKSSVLEIHYGWHFGQMNTLDLFSSP
jgi:hypothetical protein